MRLLQGYRIGALRLRHRFKTSGRLLGKFTASDDQSDFGVEPDRALVEIHRADIQAAAVEYHELGVQGIVTVARNLPRLTTAAHAVQARTYLKELRTLPQQRFAVVRVAGLRRQVRRRLERIGQNPHAAMLYQRSSSSLSSPAVGTR